jgi:uncharacterized protein (DUF1330 family)
MPTDSMIYITQIVFIKEGKEEIYNRFEATALALMEKYSGKLIYRFRPDSKSLIQGDSVLPYEIHFISFDSEASFKEFLNDDTRKAFLHLKEESVQSAILVKGHRL